MHTVTVSNELEARLIAEISASGPMPFEDFVEHALYDSDHGFYAVHGQAGGRGGDFVTSVEVGPLFAAIIGDWLDHAWHDAGEPAEFRVAEVGAGVGTLFRGINRAAPQCFDALIYTLVERSEEMRRGHQSLPSSAWRSDAALPQEHQHVILANELLDNLAFGIAQQTGHGWAPVRVAVDGSALCLAAGPVSSALDHLAKLVPNASVGMTVPVAAVAADWIDHAQRHADRVLMFDYGATTAELADRGQSGWLRTYVGHTRGSDPLAHMGRCDITHDVPLDQLPPPADHCTQAEWLERHGVAARLDAARKLWHERSHIGDLEAMVARSAVNEAEALTDPTGLGAFAVLEWRTEE